VLSSHGPRSVHPHAGRDRDRRPATAGAACPKHAVHPHAGRDRDRRPATAGAACPKHHVDRPPGALAGWLLGDVGLRGIMWGDWPGMCRTTPHETVTASQERVRRRGCGRSGDRCRVGW